MNFLAEVRAGRITVDQIETYVAGWHAAPVGSPAAQVDLHEYLGMTWEQYVQWVVTREIPL